MRRNIPSTQALACFEVAARHESYTRAAQELFLTQSAVSRQIQALEEFLGVQLFRRTRHGVVLTPAGAHYGRQVARWLQGLERDTLDVMAHQGEGGALSLAAVPTFATRWLIPRLPQLAQAHPDIVVHIDTQTRPFLFADTTFDAALYAGTPEQVAHWPGVQAQLLMHEDVVPVCSPRLLESAAPRGRGRAHQPVAAEALAELWHMRMREELGIDGDDSPHIKALFTQQYRGSRYSFGYPACPEMSDQERLFRLLEPERIGCRLTENWQIDPEQSTSAIIVHHPEAKYFNV